MSEQRFEAFKSAFHKYMDHGWAALDDSERELLGMRIGGYDPADPAVKGVIGDKLRDVLRRLGQGLSNILPREATPEESEEYRRRRAGPDPETEAQQRQQAAQEKIARYRQEFDRRVTELGKQLGDRKITPQEFRAQMLIEIRFNLITAAAAAAGSVGSLTPADLQRVDAKVREQTRYLDNWIAQIERQPQKEWSGDALGVRARMYGGSAEALASETIDKNVHGEFPNLPFYPKQRTACRANCKCRWEWRNVDREKGNADVYWLLGRAEHCKQCIARAEAFSPLQIRNWNFVNMPPDLSQLIIA